MDNRTSRYIVGLSGWDDFGWAICASMSLSSSKYLLVDSNLHYPFRLYILQMSFTIMLSTFGFCLEEEQLLSLVPATACARTICLRVLEPGLVAIPGMLGLQAILHFPNLATVGMLPVC